MGVVIKTDTYYLNALAPLREADGSGSSAGGNGRVLDALKNDLS
jgi:hypothetical protein